MKSVVRSIWLGVGLFACGAGAQVSVTTHRYDLAKTGANLTETALTPANVVTGSFGPLWSAPVDGQVYAQPLVLTGVNAAGSTRTAVYVATQNDSVYGFDADTGAPLWTRSLLPPGATPVPSTDVGTNDITPTIGITGTPVIDPTTGILYVVAKTKESGSAVQRLYALDVATGQDRHAPAVIVASVPGSGAGAVGNAVPFNPLTENQRAALVLANGTLYVTWASHGDGNPYHGWVLAFDPGTLALTGTFNTTPNGSQAGIWQSGAGPSVDPGGNLYLVTGNGTFSASAGSYGNAVLKLGPAPSLPLLDWFVPYNYQVLNGKDFDLGSAGVLLLPDQPGAHPHLALTGGKEGTLYLLDRDALGQFDPAMDHVVGTYEGPDPRTLVGLFSTPAYFAGQVYYARTGDTLKARTLSAGLLSDVTSQTSTSFGFPGATPTISANGSQAGIVWVIENGVPLTLHAYDATDLSREVYRSQQAGDGVKFTAPVVANGKVFVGSQSQLTVFGLLSVAVTIPLGPANLTATLTAATSVHLEWQDVATNEDECLVERSLDGSTWSTVFRLPPNTTQVDDPERVPGLPVHYRVRASNVAGASSPSNQADVSPPASSDGALVAAWPFDEGQGTTTADVSGKGHDGSVDGEVAWVEGKGAPSALSFHGVGAAISAVHIPDAPDLRFGVSDSFTVRVFANPSALPSGSNADVLAKAVPSGRGWTLGIDAAGRWSFGATAGGTASLGWHELRAVQDGASRTRTLWVDGVQVAVGVAEAGDGAGDLWIGGAEPPSGSTGGQTDSFSGVIDEVWIFQAATDAGSPRGGGTTGGCSSSGSGGAWMLFLLVPFIGLRRPRSACQSGVSIPDNGWLSNGDRLPT